MYYKCTCENTYRCCPACCEGSTVCLQGGVRVSIAELLLVLQGCWGIR